MKMLQDGENGAKKQLEILLKRFPALEGLAENIWQSYRMLAECYQRGGKLLVCGNGGSCADAEHIVGELMKGFCKKRRVDADLRQKLLDANPGDPTCGERLAETLERGLPAIALGAHTGLNTAFANDKDPEMIFAQQVLGYGQEGDVLLGVTTSGNSRNVLYAMTVAKALGMGSIALTGKDGGKAASLSDCCILAPSYETYQIQEYHLPIYHALCLMLEDSFFGE